VMTAHRWWTLDELRNPCEIVFPEDLADLVETSIANREDERAP
jgi:hypothetical protein